MIIRTKTADIRIAEKVVSILKKHGICNVQIMRQLDKRFVIAVLGSEADSIGMKMLEDVCQSVILVRNNNFFTDHYTEFQEAWKFLQDFDSRTQKDPANA